MHARVYVCVCALYVQAYMKSERIYRKLGDFAGTVDGGETDADKKQTKRQQETLHSRKDCSGRRSNLKGASRGESHANLKQGKTRRIVYTYIYIGWREAGSLYLSKISVEVSTVKVLVPFRSSPFISLRFIASPSPSSTLLATSTWAHKAVRSRESIGWRGGNVVGKKRPRTAGNQSLLRRQLQIAVYILSHVVTASKEHASITMKNWFHKC